MFERMMTLCAGTLILGAFTAVPAFAQNNWRGGDTVISEVHVDLGDPADPSAVGTLTIKGRNLVGRPNRDETLVMLGEQGPLEILGDPTDTEIKALCFVDHSLSNQDNFTCNPGDYKLTVAVVRTDRRWRRQNDFRRVSTYDLTIGSAGGNGGTQPPDSAQVEMLKKQLMLTRNALCDLTENVRLALSTNNPPVNIEQIVPDAMCGG